mmetsp:Transcript_32712/g.94693  ORF Transcript_32712/g.94693 Transcript_32712/m.94693 type:complete len:202 (-) Transcript_32712:294-899(-)
MACDPKGILITNAILTFLVMVFSFSAAGALPWASMTYAGGLDLWFGLFIYVFEDDTGDMDDISWDDYDDDAVADIPNTYRFARATTILMGLFGLASFIYACIEACKQEYNKTAEIVFGVISLIFTLFLIAAAASWTDKFDTFFGNFNNVDEETPCAGVCGLAWFTAILEGVVGTLWLVASGICGGIQAPAEQPAQATPVAK